MTEDERHRLHAERNTENERLLLEHVNRTASPELQESIRVTLAAIAKAHEKKEGN